MDNKEARQIVAEGLENRKLQRAEEAREAKREQFEQDMITACNKNCADRKKTREKEEMSAQRRAAIAAAKAKAWELECKANNAVRIYGVLCLVVLLVSAVTKLPFWAAMSLIVGGTAPLAAYIYRLFVPIKEV